MAQGDDSWILELLGAEAWKNLMGAQAEVDGLVTHCDGETLPAVEQQDLPPTGHWADPGTERPYQCSDCGKSFRQNRHLAQHRRTHGEYWPFSCTYCGRGFSHLSNLVRHRRCHTGERPYCCPDCGASFKHSTHLVVHRRRHTGERPYTCAQCSKCFARRAHFTAHQRVHTGERPHRCLACGRAFRQSAHLARHWKTHAGKYLEPGDGDGVVEQAPGFRESELVDEAVENEVLERRKAQSPRGTSCDSPGIPSPFLLSIQYPKGP